MTPAIRVDNLGKRYRIQSFGRSSTLLGETILSKFRRPRGHVARDLWAVRDVSFEVAHGEVLGLIGRNGAGKSTLLKLLARVTQPTTGRAVLDGRVGSLLEVGTGFHPELTGRENIFLSGSILGMRRREIAAKFDEIVAFAEIDAFLDTPVKRYSSGMYLRLAFAVAAHLPTEILLVDEVLAVGDWAFQKKCLDAMKDNVRTGRTVVFVSHNMVAVNALCQRAILVADGQVSLDGPAQGVTAEYLGRARSQRESQGITAVIVNAPALERARIPGLRFTAVRVTNPTGGPPGAGDPLDIELDYQATNQFSALAFAISLRDPSGVDVLHLSTMPISGVPIDALHANGTVVLSIPALPLSAGRYYVDLGFARERVEWLLQVEDVAEFDVEPRDVYGSGFAPLRQHGVLVTPHHWTHRPSGAAPDQEPAPVSHA